jgi:hypothetical protein
VAALRCFFVWGAFHSPEAPLVEILEQAKTFRAIGQSLSAPPAFANDRLMRAASSATAAVRSR